ncbi:hypothetical protein ACXGQW_11170 [Wenyingzhuangia sp. IMCC45533]
MKEAKFYIHKQILIKEIELQEKILKVQLQKPASILEIVMASGLLSKIGLSKRSILKFSTGFSRLSIYLDRLKSVSSIFRHLQAFAINLKKR